jgi:hypothetical protein
MHLHELSPAPGSKRDTSVLVVVLDPVWVKLQAKEQRDNMLVPAALSALVSKVVKNPYIYVFQSVDFIISSAFNMPKSMWAI